MEVVTIKQFLHSHKVHISSEWLEHCINWCKDEALPAHHTIDDLKEKVFEQWLLLDLRDVEVPCLPPNLSSKEKYSLNGTYFLQVMEVVDISKPKYWQLQKIRNETPKNLENENMNSKRLLMLSLTDGVQEVKAMELKPIPVLNLNLIPGVKVKLMGTVVVRRGRLILEEHNIKVIGGEVDTILVSNAAENILARHLKLQLNPNPIRVQESMIATIEQLNNSDTLCHTQNSTYNLNSSNVPINQRTNMTNQFHENLSNTVRCSENLTHNQNISNSLNNQKNTTNQFNDMDDFFEDEERINEEIELIMELEQANNSNQISIKKNIRQKTPDIFGDEMEIDDSSFDKIEIPDSPKITSNLKQKLPEKTIDLSQSLEEGLDIFENIDVDIDLNTQNHHSSQTASTMKNPSNNKTPSSLPKTNIWSIEKLKKNLPNITNGKFKIKARFKSIVEKLSVAEDKFHLIVEVEDDSGSVYLKFADEVVGSLAECTVDTLMNLKSQVQNNIFEAQVKVLGILKTLKDNLIKFDSVVEILVDSKEKHPVLSKIL